MLRTASYEVFEFASATEFLVSLKSDTPGCLVLDVLASRDPGEDVRASLDQRGIQMPIIVISAKDDLETRASARRAKAVAFFRKPVDGAALLDTIRWALKS